MNVVLMNNGNGPLSITGVTVTGTNATSFAETNTCGANVNAGASCSIMVTFTPTTSGSLSGAISIADNATGSPQMIGLTGMGAAFSAPVVSPSQLTLTAGQMGTVQATVSSEGGFTGNVNLSCTGAPAQATCTPVPAMLTLTSGGTGTSMVNITTTAHSALPPPAGAPRSPLGPRTAAPALAMLVMAGVFYAMRRSGRLDAAMSRRLAGIALASVLLWVGLLSACGSSGSSSNTGTPAGTYTLMVTAAAGNQSQSSPVTLTVQ